MTRSNDIDRFGRVPLLDDDVGTPSSNWTDTITNNLPNIQVLLIGVLIFFVCYLASKLLQFSIAVLWICAGVALFSFVHIEYCSIGVCGANGQLITYVYL